MRASVEWISVLYMFTFWHTVFCPPGANATLIGHPSVPPGSVSVRTPVSGLRSLNTSAPDERTIKTLMTAAHSGANLASDKLPLIVTELFDADQLRAARRAYPGPAELIGPG